MTPRHLLLVRHAQAAWEHGAITDFDRVLTEEGEHDADQLAAWLGKHSPRPSAIVTSTAPRALTTAKRLATGWPDAPTLTLEPSLYEAPLDGPARLIAGLPDAWDRVLIVGHNPALSHTADWLLGEPTILELPAGGLVWLEINAPHWRSLVPGCARVRAVQAPERLVRGR
jgi:phosphohistidine phosphatase